MIDHFHRFTIPAAYALLPPAMASDKATAMLLAIGLQESAFTHRRQTHGSAHGWFQFERIATKDVLEHPRTEAAASEVIDLLRYRLRGVTTVSRQVSELYDAVTHNDTLACCFARLNLWKLPVPLPGPEDAEEGFGQYISIWRPGAFLRGTDDQKQQLRTAWGHHYAEAWARVQAAL